MIVVDANVVAYATIKGAKTPVARQLRAVDRHWVMPSLCRHELANVLLSHVRSGTFTEQDIVPIWDKIALVTEGNEREVSLPSVVRLANERSISAYDAQYVWLARELNKPLITEDRQLISRCTDVAHSMSQYLESAT